jgi:hypothetical protein
MKKHSLAREGMAGLANRCAPHIAPIIVAGVSMALTYAAQRKAEEEAKQAALDAASKGATAKASAGAQFGKDAPPSSEAASMRFKDFSEKEKPDLGTVETSLKDALNPGEVTARDISSGPVPAAPEQRSPEMGLETPPPTAAAPRGHVDVATGGDISMQEALDLTGMDPKLEDQTQAAGVPTEGFDYNQAAGLVGMGAKMAMASDTPLTVGPTGSGRFGGRPSSVEGQSPTFGRRHAINTQYMNDYFRQRRG